jgi:hypothetical protein
MSKTTGVDPLDLIEFIMPSTIEAGESTTVSQSQQVDYCADGPITTTLTAKADPGGCEAETTIEFQPSRRRALRGN